LTRRLRVVTLVETATAQGGGERIAMQIAMRLDRQRFESIVCGSRLRAEALTGPQRAAHDELHRAGVRTLALGRSHRLDLAAWAPLIRLLRRERVDILHAHMFGSNLWGTLIGRGVRVPVIVAHEHGWAVQTGRLRQLADREIIARWSDAFVAVSEDARQRMINSAGIDPCNVIVVHNGIAPPPPGPAHDLRAELGIPGDAPVIATAAVLRREKELDVLLRSAAVLRARVPGLHVVIAGAGPERPDLERLTRALGLQDAVFFLGFRPDVPAVFGASDVAVFSSATEGSPLAVMEAMEVGRPIVATRVGGVPDLIEDEVHGLLVPPHDPGALAAAVERALRDRVAATAMGTRARERRRREFDIDGTVRQLEQLYEERYARSVRGRRHRASFVPRRPEADSGDARTTK
jgi:glycosyltransferase involved in cell wall biosynthesis